MTQRSGSMDLEYSLPLMFTAKLQTHIFISHPKQGAIIGWVTHKPSDTEKSDSLNPSGSKMYLSFLMNSV